MLAIFLLENFECFFCCSLHMKLSKIFSMIYLVGEKNGTEAKQKAGKKSNRGGALKCKQFYYYDFICLTAKTLSSLSLSLSVCVCVSVCVSKSIKHVGGKNLGYSYVPNSFSKFCGKKLIVFLRFDRCLVIRILGRGMM